MLTRGESSHVPFWKVVYAFVHLFIQPTYQETHQQIRTEHLLCQAFSVPWGYAHEPNGKDPCSHKARLLVQRLSKETKKRTLGSHLAARAGTEMKWVTGWRRLGCIQVAAASDGVTGDGLSSFRVVGMGIRPGACWQQVKGSSPVTNSAVTGPHSSLYVFVS